MGNKYYVVLKGLRFQAPIGVLEQEQVTGNDITIDLRIGYPMAKAMESDDVADTLNYADVYNIVKQEATRKNKLLERLTGKIADRLTRKYPEISSIDMAITKLNPPMGGDTDGAGVEIHLINTKTEV